MIQERKDYLTLHFIVLIWGFTAILGLLINIPSVEVVFYRTLIAAIGLFVVLKFWKRPLRINSSKHVWIILGTGALIAAHWILFFLSARISNASVCLAGMATCSLWTSLIEPISQGRKIKGFEVLLSIIAFIGIGVIFNVEFDYLSGLLTAVLSAFIASVFTVINGRLTKTYDPYVITFYEMVGACVAIAMFFPIYSMYFVDSLTLNPSASDWLYLGVLAIVCTVYAYSISVELMKRLSAFSINLVVNLEPVYGIILALIIFGDSEEMSPGFYLGTLLILTSVLLYPLLNRRYKKKALSTDIIR
ncbi:Permease of the drug/metabolite transporter (DMT) superfamily [Ekhidna lutea]|uniref:Permease of the drug/metabolite transporter (DMT) superfamily n=1 Tax=Ekhidna lutea TaxID=447679 RepID=A0A239JNK7_EKHLU|nr:DMT family transporter [Ekhidna lutea]SNT07349.1 Permease of the drug/metabolite transporter (DMT) superfamily [Ekhidna lutea]